MISIKPTIFIITLSLIFSSFSYGQDTTTKASAVITAPSISKVDTVYVDVPNTSIQIIPPAYFVFMESAGGFLHVGTSASIQVQEITGTAFTMIAPGLSKEYFKTQGATLLNTEDVVNKKGLKGKLYTVSFLVENVEFERLLFFTGDYNNTIWINANYPVAVREMLNPVLRECLLTAQFKQK